MDTTVLSHKSSRKPVGNINERYTKGNFNANKDKLKSGSKYPEKKIQCTHKRPFDTVATKNIKSRKCLLIC